MATYYVKNGGNDALAGTSELNAWGSIAKVNATSFSAGDIILFKRGETFRGVLNPASSGASGNPITIGAYGTGADPIISAFTSVTSWTSLGSNIWSATVNSGSTYRTNMVTIGGISKSIGRYPTTGWATISSATGSNPGAASITGNLPTSPVSNWTGAEVTIRKTAWIIDHDVITSQSGSTISYTITAGHGEGPYNGYGYFIQNDVKTLVATGDWSHDKASNTMKMFSTVNPSGLAVEAATSNTVMTTNKSYIKFENIQFWGGNLAIVNVTGSTGLTFNNCTFRYSGKNGIQADGATGVTLFQCVVTDIANVGAYLQGSGTSVTYCDFYNIGMVWGMAANDNQAALGLLVANGTNILIEKNNVYNVGYNGIVLAGGADTTLVKNNNVHDVMKKASDGGGIYMGQSGTGREISNNIVTDIIGDITGTNHSGKASVGIYLDDNSSGVLVKSNYVARTDDCGYYLHNAHDVELAYNVAIDCVNDLYKIANDNLGGDVYNLNVHNNVAICRNSSQVALAIYDQADNIASYGTFINNIYNKLSNQSQVITKRINSGGGYPSPTFYSIASWFSTYGKEAGTLAAPNTFSSGSADDIIFVENKTGSVTNTYLNGVFTNGTTTFTGSTNIPAYTGYVLFKTGDITTGPLIRGIKIAIQL